MKKISKINLFKILCAYLPHGLKIQRLSKYTEDVGTSDESDTIEMDEEWIQTVIDNDSPHYSTRLILKPLENYKETGSKEMDELKIKLIDQMLLSHFALGRITLGQVKHRIIEIMNENHIDYNGLIERKQAIDYKTLKK